MNINRKLDNAQLTYLTNTHKIQAATLDAVQVLLMAGADDKAFGHLAKAGVSAADIAVIKEDMAKIQAPAVSGMPRQGGVAVQIPAQPAVPLAPVSNEEYFRELLTTVNRDGTIRRKGGLNKIFVDNPNAWPTVDAFGRPFPSLADLRTMPKADARAFITQSAGMPKCQLDGVSYYVHEQAGPDFLTMRAAMEQAYQANAAKGVTQAVAIDPKTLPVTIAAGTWRWWNGQMGGGALYGRPDQHEQICATIGRFPSDYKALMASRQPQTVAAPTQEEQPTAEATPAQAGTTRRRRR